MKKMRVGLLAVVLVAACFLTQAWSEELMPQTGQAADPWTQAQALINKGGVENCKKALDMCLEVVKIESGGFQANWMAAQACREYGLAVKKSETKGWEKVCKEYGKKGMAFAEKAIAVDPAKAQGYYWFGMSVGIYSDGVSILTALKEGLKDKTQNNLETAYKIDKTYDKYGSVGALGRFWQVLPWPLNDTDKSIEYYREYQKTKDYNDPDTVEIRIYLAEILMESGKTKDEAKTLLNEAVKITDASGDRYWNKRVKELLANL